MRSLRSIGITMMLMLPSAFIFAQQRQQLPASGVTQNRP